MVLSFGPKDLLSQRYNHTAILTGLNPPGEAEVVDGVELELLHASVRQPGLPTTPELDQVELPDRLLFTQFHPDRVDVDQVYCPEEPEEVGVEVHVELPV